MKLTHTRLEFFPILFLTLNLLVFWCFPLAASAANTAIADQRQPQNQYYPNVTVLSSDEQGIILEFNPPIPEFNQVEIDGEICIESKISGLSGSQNAGNPSLPVQGAMIGIPTDAQPSILVRNLDQEMFHLAYKLCPVAKKTLDLAAEKQDPVKTEYPWGASYLQAAYLPDDIVELADTGYLRSQRYMQIRFNPIQYHAKQDSLLFNKSIQVEIRFNSSGLSARSLEENLPKEIAFEKSLNNILLNYEQARNWRQAFTPALPLETTSVKEDQPYYKILVDQDGFFTVSYADLQNAGAPVGSIEPATIQLFNQSQEISIQVTGQEDGIFDPGDEIIFFGQRLHSKYSEMNVYWLTWGTLPGLRMQPINASINSMAITPSSFSSTQRAEKDSLYTSSQLSGPENDHWYWGFIYASSGLAFADYSTEIHNISSDNTTITIRGLIKGWHAISEHHTIIYLNGNFVGDYRFPIGTELHFSITGVPASFLVEGVNILRVECPRDDPITLDGIYFNWFEIDYLDSFMAENDQIEFTYDQPGTWEFNLDGFSSTNLEAYDLTDPKNPKIIQNITIQDSANGQELTFETTISDKREFWAQAISERLSPLSIVQDEISNWKSPEHGADYIVITHTDFTTQSEQLADIHSNNGLRVQVVDVQDVYDEFNGGMLSPEAIHDFLKYAYANWTPPSPTYVLLMGDGHYDFKNNLGTSGPNFIPPFLDEVDTTVGETAVDNRYACVNGEDVLPDLYIGRFPVRTAQEAATMVEKTTIYATTVPDNNWNESLLFVADDPEGTENFPLISDQIIDTYISDPYTAEKIYYLGNYPDASSVRNGIVNAINLGKLIVHYNGHGAIPFWASPALFKLEDLPRLTNQDKLPFMLPMTCAEGYFVKPYSPTVDSSSLGESIVRMSGGGAIASWSATGYGYTPGHVLFEQSIFTDLFENNLTELGILTTNAKYYLYSQTTLFKDMIETYTLFGDPALDLRIIQPEVSIPIYLPIISKSENISGIPVISHE